MASPQVINQPRAVRHSLGSTVQQYHPSHRFAVGLQASSADEPIVLRSAADPNNATIAFHEELQRLTTQGTTGELLMWNHHKGHTPILRQPLDRLSSKPEQIRRK
jgi:hypothetical protein